MFKYSPPSNLDDLKGRPTRTNFLNDWHAWIESQIRDEICSLINPPRNRQGRRDFPVRYPLFFCEVDDPADATDLPITWNAFPLSVARRFGNQLDDALSYLDTLEVTTDFTPRDAAQDVTTKYRRHDEYCEWHYYKDGPLGPRIVFTAEGPEYWIQLANHDFERVVELYQTWVSPEVQREDLELDQDIVFGQWRLRKGDYNPFNIWNTEKGIMHLTQPANTLGAEINLAARATVLRKAEDDERIVDARRLIASSGFGSINRSSDPNIGFGVNITAVPTHAADPLSITLANPVGLYMDRVEQGKVTDANDIPLAGWFDFKRGSAGRGLMAVLQPPEGDTRTLEDVFIEGERLKSGGQVARFIQMVLYGATAQLGAPQQPLHPPFYRACVRQGTDTSDLSKTNLLAGFSAEQTCEAQGNTLQPPIALDDAYPDLFTPSSVSTAVTSAGLRAPQTTPPPPLAPAPAGSPRMTRDV